MIDHSPKPPKKPQFWVAAPSAISVQCRTIGLPETDSAWDFRDPSLWSAVLLVCRIASPRFILPPVYVVVSAASKRPAEYRVEEARSRHDAHASVGPASTSLGSKAASMLHQHASSNKYRAHRYVHTLIVPKNHEGSTWATDQDRGRFMHCNLDMCSVDLRYETHARCIEGGSSPVILIAKVDDDNARYPRAQDREYTVQSLWTRLARLDTWHDQHATRVGRARPVRSHARSSIMDR
nr:hypothetical protein CFP56_44301 [Quercus suber]